MHISSVVTGRVSPYGYLGTNQSARLALRFASTAFPLVVVPLVYFLINDRPRHSASDAVSPGR